MSEPARRVSCRYLPQRSPDRFDERLAAAGCGLLQQRLDLREGLFDGREIRRIGRQKQQRAALALDQFAHPLSLVRAEIVQYDYLPGPERGRQYSFDV